MWASTRRYALAVAADVPGGLGKAAVYRLYPTKDALIGGYLGRLAGDIATAIAFRIVEEPRDPRRALPAIVDDIAVDLRRSDFGGCAFNNASIVFDDPDHPGRVLSRAYRVYLLAIFTEAAEELDPEAGAVLGARLPFVIDACYASATHRGPDGPAAEGLALARRLIADA